MYLKLSLSRNLRQNTLKPHFKMFKSLKTTKGNFLHIRHITTVTNVDGTATPTKPFRDVPGPTTLPGIGQLHHYLPGGSFYNLEGFKLREFLYKKYGPVVKMNGHFGARDTILLYDPEVALQLYRTENALPLRSGFFAAQYYKDVIKKKKGEERKYNGLIFDHEEKWREIRTVINPVMMQAKLLKPYVEPLNEIAQEAVARLKSLRNENDMIENNLLDEFMLYILEFTGQFAFGHRYYAFAPNVPEDAVSRKLLSNIHRFLELSHELDFQPNLWRYFPNKTFRTAMKFLEDAEKMNENLIRTIIEKNKSDPKPEEKQGILEKLVEIDEDVAIAFADDILFVGVDSVANAFTSVLYLLATNPEKQTKLREEILSNGSRQPYLRACIKEAARMRPVAFGNMRITTTNHNVFGYDIPKDIMVLICHEHMCLREDQYPQPHQYIPERWIVDKDHPLYHGNAHPNTAVHFGYGSRGCIGRKAADMEMEILLSRILQNFNVGWRGKPMSVYQSVSNHNLGPYNFVFSDI